MGNSMELLKINRGQAVQFLRSRRSVRLYKDKPVEKEKTQEFIVTAWDKGMDRVLRDAPVLVVAHAPKEALNGMVDLTLALSYFELAAPPYGLGTCWAGLLQGALLSRPEIKELLGLPEKHPHHYPMMLGYAKPKYYRLPERKPPKIVWG